MRGKGIYPSFILLFECFLCLCYKCFCSYKNIEGLNLISNSTSLTRNNKTIEQLKSCDFKFHNPYSAKHD